MKVFVLITLQSCVIGVMVPDPETFSKWCHEKLDTNGMGISELCKNLVRNHREKDIHIAIEICI